MTCFLHIYFLLYFRFWGTYADHAGWSIGTHMAMWFAASIPHHLHLAFLPMLSLSDLLTTPAVPPLAPPPCNRLCVHVLSWFITHLWVRICSVWFSVLVSVCWELRFTDSSMSLQRTQTRHFYGCIVFHGVYVPHFPCPVYRWQAFGLVPGLCYCKQCRNEHTCACVFIREWFIILWVYTQ